MSSDTVFFDIGNTLATGLEISARRLLAARLGLSEKETRRAGRLLMTCPATDPASLAAAVGKCLPSRGTADIAVAVAAIWEEQIHCIRPVPGASALLEALKAEGCRLGIVSNTWHPAFIGFRRACPSILDLFDSVTLSYREGCKKPSADIYCKALESVRANPRDCWMVGDSYELDVEPARRAGMKTVWVLSRPERELSTLAQIINGCMEKPDLVVTGLDDLTDFRREKVFAT